MSSSTDDLILKHYKEVAKKHGASPNSSMEDDIVREREIGLVLKVVDTLSGGRSAEGLKILDLGCGNGYMLKLLTERFPAHSYWGVDFSSDLLEVARGRNLANCTLTLGDARSMDFEPDFFDLVYTERCLINIMDEDQQIRSLREIGRVLKPEAHYLMIECFADGLANNNKARLECDLEPIKEAYHNKYLEKAVIFPGAADMFTIVDPSEPAAGLDFTWLQSNFLSSHYFMTRVFYPFVAQGKWKRNTEFARFFSFLPPMGEYSPIQAYLLRKTGGIACP